MALECEVVSEGRLLHCSPHGATNRHTHLQLSLRPLPYPQVFPIQPSPVVMSKPLDRLTLASRLARRYVADLQVHKRHNATSECTSVRPATPTTIATPLTPLCVDTVSPLMRGGRSSEERLSRTQQEAHNLHTLTELQKQVKCLQNELHVCTGAHKASPHSLCTGAHKASPHSLCTVAHKASPHSLCTVAHKASPHSQRRELPPELALLLSRQHHQLKNVDRHCVQKPVRNKNSSKKRSRKKVKVPNRPLHRSTPAPIHCQTLSKSAPNTRLKRPPTPSHVVNHSPTPSQTVKRPPTPSHVVNHSPTPPQTVKRPPTQSPAPPTPSHAVNHLPIQSQAPPTPSQAVNHLPTPSQAPLTPSQAVNHLPTPSQAPLTPSQAVNHLPTPLQAPPTPSQAVNHLPTPSQAPPTPPPCVDGLLERLCELEAETEVIRDKWRSVTFDDHLPTLTLPAPPHTVTAAPCILNPASLLAGVQRYSHYLELTGTSTKGGFDPWAMAERISDEVLMDLVECVAAQVETVCSSCIDRLYSVEFRPPTQ